MVRGKLQNCPKCGIEFKYSHKCKLDLPKNSPSENSSSSENLTPTEGDTYKIFDGEFPTVDKDLPKIQTKKGKSKEPLSTEGGGELFGLSEFLLTAKEWINSFWEKPPYIKLSERTALRLEAQFNKAFGIYVKPIVGFLLSVFLIFGLPIMIHLIGKELIMDAFNKFQKGMKEKLKFKKGNLSDNNLSKNTKNPTGA